MYTTTFLLLPPLPDKGLGVLNEDGLPEVPLLCPSDDKNLDAAFKLSFDIFTRRPEPV